MKNVGMVYIAYTCMLFSLYCPCLHVYFYTTSQFFYTCNLYCVSFKFGPKIIYTLRQIFRDKFQHPAVHACTSIPYKSDDLYQKVGTEFSEDIWYPHFVKTKRVQTSTCNEHSAFHCVFWKT